MAGWSCLLLGIIMLFTPGQGLLTIIIGVYLLADHVPFFARMKDRLETRFPKATAYVHRKAEQLRNRFHHETDETHQK